MTQLELHTYPVAIDTHDAQSSPTEQRVGPWRLMRLAARGPLTELWQARPAEAPNEVPGAYALKMLLPDWDKHPHAIAMLQREAAVGRAVSHPHLVPVLAANTSQQPYYVVMPWLNGQSLAQRLAAGWRPDVPVALWIARQISEALAALHAGGWMHGDVKPANIFLSANHHVTLLDLGFARCADEPGSIDQRCVLGTCQYLAPEVVTSALRPDIRSDVYSLGVVLFEMLSARLPFSGENLSELVAQHKQCRPPDLKRLAPNVPSEVARLVATMLAKQPVRRPFPPRELSDRLANLEILTFSQRSVG